MQIRSKISEESSTPEKELQSKVTEKPNILVGSTSVNLDPLRQQWVSSKSFNSPKVQL